MINSELNNINKRKIVNAFSKYKRNLIDSIVIRTMTEYELWLSIYSCDKNNFNNSIDAFSCLWLTYLIDCEEWHSYYQSNYEFAEAVYKNFFINYILELQPSPIKLEFAEQYINNAILHKTDLILRNRNTYPVDNYNLIYSQTGIPGIYLNLKMVDEKKFSFTLPSIVNAIELKYDNTWAGYRDIFIETKDKYLFFSE